MRTGSRTSSSASPRLLRLEKREKSLTGESRFFIINDADALQTETDKVQGVIFVTVRIGGIMIIPKVCKVFI